MRLRESLPSVNCIAMSGGDGSDGGINRNWVVVVVVGSDGLRENEGGGSRCSTTEMWS